MRRAQKEDSDDYHYFSSSTFNERDTVLFTVSKLERQFNGYWHPDMKEDTSGEYCDDVASVTYEIPAVYGNPTWGIGDGTAEIGTYTYGNNNVKVKSFGLKITGTLPEVPVLLKQTVTYKSGIATTEVPNYVSYVLLGKGYVNPENAVIDMDEDERTIQEVILQEGENTTIKLSANKTYEENIVIPWYVAIEGRSGSVIKAKTAKPVIQSKSYMRPVEIKGVTIDGNGKTAIGVETAGGFFVALTDCIIQNCSAGLKFPKDGGVENCTIQNNTIGIDFFQQTGNGWTDLVKAINNGTGVKFSAGYRPSAYGRFAMQRFIVRDNSVKNINADEATADIIEFRNNFIELSEGNPDLSKIADTWNKLRLDPFFKSEQMDTVTADIKKLDKTEDGKQLVLPYATANSKDNNAPIIDSNVFDSIMKSQSTPARALGTNPNSAIMKGFDQSGELAYSFSMGEIKTPMNFNTKFDENVTKAVKVPGNVMKSRFVSFKHSGNIPSDEMTVTLADPDSKFREGDTPYLYLMNPSTKKLEKAGNVKVEVIKGITYLTFTMNHCSDYLITDVNVTQGGGSNPPPYYPPISSGSSTSSTVTEVIDSKAITEAISDAKNNKVSIDTSKTPIMSGESFAELAKNPGITLELKGDGFTWSFKGNDINPQKMTGVAFNTQISKKSPNVDQIKRVSKGLPLETIYFSHHGELPGKATIKVETEFRDEFVKLYYFNASLLRFEYSGEARVDSNGIATFEISHCSDYVLSSTIIEDAVGNPILTSPPQTGVEEKTEYPFLFFTSFLAIAGVILVMVAKARRTNKQTS